MYVWQEPRLGKDHGLGLIQKKSTETRETTCELLTETTLFSKP